MNPNRVRIILSFVVAASACTWASAAYGDDDFKLGLSIGDKAPAIDIEHWIKGDKVKEFEKGKVYVVEFWATWCGPCVQSMSHLSELQKEYAKKGVTIIGISDEDLGTVTGFLKKKYKPENKTHDERVQYTLTTDPDKSTKQAYMRAAKQNGIPTAFLVGKTGKIEWIGHPMALDNVLKEVVEDKWDAKAFKIGFEATTQLDALLNADDMAGANKLLDKLMKDDPENPTYLHVRFTVQLGLKKVEEALKTLDTLERLMGGKCQFSLWRARILCGQKKYDTAYKIMAADVKDNWDDANTLNDIAWFIVDEPALEKRDLKLALKAAKRACELTQNEDASILDTLARAHYESGDLKEAVDWQTKAVEVVGKDGGRMGDEIRKTLEKYKAEAEAKKQTA